MKTKMMILAIGLVTGLGVAAGHTVAMAQGHAHAARAAATLEGTWRVQITLRHCGTWAPLGQPFPALASFHSGGTLTTSDGSMSPAARGAGHGVWTRTSGRHFEAVTEAFLFTDGVRSGTQQLAQEIALANDGQTFESIVSAEVFNATGQIVFTGCASSLGDRMR